MNIGIVGGGQLARMLALAGIPLGLRFTVLDPAPDACAGDVATLINTAYDDPQGLAALAEKVDLVTFDFENVPASAARLLRHRVPVFPPVDALEVAQDRLSEKKLLQSLGIPTAPFAAVDTIDELKALVARLNFPVVLKTRRFGYDGKGQRILHAPQDITSAWNELSGQDLIMEDFVHFQSEASMLAARSHSGEIVFYPLVENQHRNGILYRSVAPCSSPKLEQRAREYVGKVMEHLDYVGLLAVEFFIHDGRLLANEMAPRVHNTGHWTIEGAETSQFENHLRAGLNVALGSTRARGCAAMINFVGDLPERAAVLATGAHFHHYGKKPRPGRKVGHATVCAEDQETLQHRLAELMALADSVWQ